MSETNTYLTVKDYSVSGELFKLLPNETHGFLETIPQPKEVNLSEYYKSEDYISHTDSKRSVFEKVYHFIRRISLKRKLKLINSLDSKERKILDVGCGTGDFLKLAQDNNWQVTGIEPNEKAREISNYKTNNSVYNSQRLYEFKNQSFDIITLWHVLEHLPNLEDHITLFKNLLKENGTIIVAVPNFKSFDAHYYKNFWAAYDVPRHLWHFDQNSMENLFASKGLCIEKTLPLKFDAYYVSLLSEKHKIGFLNPLRAFWIGLRSNFKARRSGEYSSLIYLIKNT